MRPHGASRDGSGSRSDVDEDVVVVVADRDLADRPVAVHADDEAGVPPLGVPGDHGEPFECGGPGDEEDVAAAPPLGVGAGGRRQRLAGQGPPRVDDDDPGVGEQRGVILDGVDEAAGVRADDEGAVRCPVPQFDGVGVVDEPHGRVPGGGGVHDDEARRGDVSGAVDEVGCGHGRAPRVIVMSSSGRGGSPPSMVATKSATTRSAWCR